MVYGDTITEGLNTDEFIKEFNVLKMVIENRPEADTKIWHWYLVKREKEGFEELLEKISKATKEGWYSIFWDEEYYYIAAQNKTFKFKRVNENEELLKEIKRSLTKNGIQEEYLDFEEEVDRFNRELKT